MFQKWLVIIANRKFENLSENFKIEAIGDKSHIGLLRVSALSKSNFIIKRNAMILFTR